VVGDGFGVVKRDQNSTLLRQQFSRVPVRCGDHRFAGAENVGESAGNNLRLVEIGRDVNVGGADEFLQLIDLDKFVIEDDALVDFVFLSQAFEAEPVGLALFSDEIGMSGAENDVNEVRI